MSLFSIKNATTVSRPEHTDFPKFATGAEIMLSAAELGKKEKACAVIVAHQRFNGPATKYTGQVILVNSAKIFVPLKAQMPGTELARKKSLFVALNPEGAKEFLKAV